MTDPYVWFGNLRKAVWLPAPRRGMEAGPRGRIEKVDLANGGSFVSMSQATHREYDMEWGATNHDLLRPLYDYRNGIYGPGLIYMCDPWASNALPPHWAEPFLSTQDWPSIYSSGAQGVATAEGVVRTNYAPDPNVDNLSQWTASGGATAPTFVTVLGPAGAVRGASFGRLTAQTAATAYEARSVQTFPVVAGENYAFSAYVRGTTSRNAQLRITWTGATATSGTSTAVASTTAWQRLSMTGAVPVGATAARLDIVGVATSVVVGNLIEFDGLLYERGTTTVGTYFDGSTIYADGRRATWAGTEDASASSTFTPNANMPKYSAAYTLSTPLGGSLPTRAAVLLIPPTKTLHIGFSGTAVNGASVYVQPILLDGTGDMPQALTLLSPSGTTRLNTSFSGATYSAIAIYLDTTTVGVSSVTLNSGKAVYVTTGSSPILTGTHASGEGSTGLRFQSEILRTYISERGNGGDNVQMVSAAVSMTEVGAWL